MKKITLATATVFLPLLLFSQVSQQWASRYGATTGTDKANALALDSSGNVYVTGSSASGGVGTEDYATVKYSTSGVELWVKKYNGLGTSISTDIAHAIVVDKRGYIYVTGESTAASGARDFLTIKYNSAGDTMWTARYNGSRGGNDIAYAIAVSDSGYVYVTGSSEGLVGTHGIWEDYATVKYDSTGVQKWATSYNGPGGDFDAAASIAVDATGNVYVTGVSGGGSTGSSDSYFDYATIKYNAAGILQWASRYTGTFFTTSDDKANQLQIDKSGNVYVTGKSSGMTTGHDYVTIKYNSTGVSLWSARYNGTGDNEDEANALAVDDSGNVYVTGNSYSGSVNGNDIVTVKYNSAGVEKWAITFNGAASSDDRGKAIALDSATNNIFITGYSFSAATAFDYATIKYNRAGAVQWSILYTNGGSAGSSDEPAAIAVDKSGNVYVTGISALDYATVKYAPSVGVSSTMPAANQWNISPNPVSGTLHLKRVSSAPETSRVSVTNLLGQEVYHSEMLGSEHYIDVSLWQKGIYFIAVSSKDNTQVARVVVCH